MLFVVKECRRTISSIRIYKKVLYPNRLLSSMSKCDGLASTPILKYFSDWLDLFCV